MDEPRRRRSTSRQRFVACVLDRAPRGFGHQPRRLAPARPRTHALSGGLGKLHSHRADRLDSAGPLVPLRIRGSDPRGVARVPERATRLPGRLQRRCRAAPCGCDPGNYRSQACPCGSARPGVDGLRAAFPPLGALRHGRGLRAAPVRRVRSLRTALPAHTTPGVAAAHEPRWHCGRGAPAAVRERRVDGRVRAAAPRAARCDAASTGRPPLVALARRHGSCAHGVSGALRKPLGRPAGIPARGRCVPPRGVGAGSRAGRLS